MTYPRMAVWLFVLGLGGVLLLSGVGVDVEPGRLIDARVMAQPKEASTPSTPPVYVPPPDVGAPVGRVGGGTRSLRSHPRDTMLHVAVLAPDHVGLTVQDQPALYWYVSRPAPEPMALTIRAEHAAAPLLQTQLRPPARPGVYRLRLADYGVRLEPQVLYRWFVVVPNREDRSRDSIGTGMIRYVQGPTALRTRIARAYKTRVPYLYAEAGYWYDAIETVSELIETTPDNPSLRQLRAALSEQVDLPEAAAYDRSIGTR